MLELLHDLSAEGVDGEDGVYLVAEILDADDVIGVGECDVYGVSFDAEPSAREFNIIAHVLCGDELFEQAVHRHLLAALQLNDVLREVLRTAQAVDATDRADDDDIFPPGEQCRHCREPQTVDFLVDGEVFLDIQVGGRDVRLGLIVVVIRDEILHRVVREEGFHLGVELRRKGLVMAHDEGGAVDLFDDVGDGEGLTGACHAEEDLRRCSCVQTVHKSFYRLRLVSCRLVW